MDKIKLKDLSLQITEKEYRALPDISYSFLSSLDKYGSNVTNREPPDNAGIKFGSLVDDILFGTYTTDKYNIADIPEPGKVLKEAIDMIVSRFTVAPKSEAELKDMIMSIFEQDVNNEIGYWNKKDSEWRADKIILEGLEYIYYLLEDDEHITVTPQQYHNAVKCVSTLKNHPFTKDIYSNSNPNVETISQFKGVFVYHPINALPIRIKFMVDWLVIDHDAKVIKPYDLKTGAFGTRNFEYPFFKLRYDIQGYVYSLGVKKVLQDKYPGYSFAKMSYTYICASQPEEVLIYSISNNLFDCIRGGYVYRNNKVKGVDELIRDHQFYLNNAYNVKFEEEVYLNNGIVEIGSDCKLKQIL